MNLFNSNFANFFFALLLPSLIIRFFFLQNKQSGEKSYQSFLALVCGLAQDIFVIFQVIFLFLLLKIMMPHSFLWAFAFIIVLSALIQLNMIFDAFFYKKTAMRMELSFFSFFNDLRCFWDSAKEKTFVWFFPSSIIFFTMHIKTFIYYEDTLFQIHFPFVFFLIGILAGGISFLGYYYLPKKISYQMNNVVFLQEGGVVKKILGIFTKKKRFEKAQQINYQETAANNSEVFTRLNENYPLLKWTSGFKGEKEFTIPLKESEKPHIVFLFMESFRAKNIGVCGAENSSSPNFDKLSEEGILFKNFYANSIKTSRAVTSSLFGIPSDIQSSNISNRPGFPMLGIADILKTVGYQTSYLHNGLLQFENQLDFFANHGFQKIIGREDILKKFPEAYKTSWGVHDEYLMHYAADWLEKEDRNGKPLFTTIFTISNHHPWTMPPNYEKAPTLSKKTAYSRYLQTFRYSDEALGLFIRLLRQKELSKKMIIFILGDHGQPMGEHQNNFSEQKGLYEENIHVPLLILADGRFDKPQTIHSLGSQVDLLPTVMDFLNIQGVNHSVGQSLLRKNPSKKVYFHNPYGLKYFGLREENYKCIFTKESKEVELFDLAADKEEQKNLTEKHPMLVQQYLCDLMHFEDYFAAIYDNYRFVPHMNGFMPNLISNFEFEGVKDAEIRRS